MFMVCPSWRESGYSSCRAPDQVARLFERLAAAQQAVGAPPFGQPLLRLPFELAARAQRLAMLGDPGHRARPLPQQGLVGGAENRLLVMDLADEQPLLDQGAHQHPLGFRGQGGPRCAVAAHRAVGRPRCHDQRENARQGGLRRSGKAAQHRFGAPADGAVDAAQRLVGRQGQLPPRAALEIELLQRVL